jgi:hypothetical protein
MANTIQQGDTVMVIRGRVSFRATIIEVRGTNALIETAGEAFEVELADCHLRNGEVR